MLCAPRPAPRPAPTGATTHDSAPDWFAAEALPAIAAMGFAVRATPCDDAVLVRVTGVLPGHRGTCPVHGRVHTKGSGPRAIYAFVRPGRAAWKCKKGA